MNRHLRAKFFFLAFLCSVAIGLSAFILRSPGGVNYASTHAISSGELLTHLKYLASDDLTGRLAGSPGAEKAAAYVSSKFKEYGLKPGGSLSFLQDFSFISGIELGRQNHFAVRTASGELKAYQLRSEFMPKAFSMSGKFEGQGVFAGYGISAPELGHQDYLGIAVKDRFVFVFRYGPDGNEPHGKFARYHPLRYKAMAAREKGAKAIVFIDDSEEFAKSTLARLQLDAEFADSGIAAFAVSQQAAKEIFQKANLDLENLRVLSRTEKGVATVLKEVEFTFESELLKIAKQTTNVIGLLKGKDPRLSNEYVIAGAHYDHLGLGEFASLGESQGKEIHNGADDNASGTAGLLELARVLASHQADLKRSIVFVAFGAEEEGLIGSKFYVNHPPYPLEKTVAMLNMDMIGRMKESRLIIGGSGSSPLWKELLHRLNETTQFELKFQDDGFGPSDHSSFYLKDIPVLFFFTGVHQDYHRASDDYDKINVEAEAGILGLIAQTLMEICQLDTRPEFSKVKGLPAETQPRGEMRVYLGTIPDYGEEVEGVKLAGVREGGPAAKAGLQTGDVIIEFAGVKIKNVYDYTYVLQERKPGDDVEIVVLRNGSRVVLKATLGQRP